MAGNIKLNSASGGSITLAAYETASDVKLTLPAMNGVAIVADFVTGAAPIPSGTTAQRPASPTTGMMRLNTTLGIVEYWTGSSWSNITGGFVVSYLCIAGGGGGGGGSANGGVGGGGAGGYLESTFTISSGNSGSVVIGAGGAGGASNADGVNGSNSTITLNGTTIVTSIGGGRGVYATKIGGSGGSGGGAAQWNYSGGLSGGTASTGQGNNGGSVSGNGTERSGAGGGGAGGAGTSVNNTDGGGGGAGRTSYITGSAVTRASGGQGWGVNGGGSGQSGAANTGNGGYSNGNGTGGTGGSGIVILSYNNPTQLLTGGTVTSFSGVVGQGTSTTWVHTFTSSGTFTA